MKCYRNITTDEVVYEEEAEEYALNRLGITVTPRGKNGEMTKEQIIEIRKSQEPDTILAKRYNASRGQIYSIKHYRTYKEVIL